MTYCGFKEAQSKVVRGKRRLATPYEDRKRKKTTTADASTVDPPHVAARTSSVSSVATARNPPTYEDVMVTHEMVRNETSVSRLSDDNQTALDFEDGSALPNLFAPDPASVNNLSQLSQCLSSSLLDAQPVFGPQSSSSAAGSELQPDLGDMFSSRAPIMDWNSMFATRAPLMYLNPPEASQRSMMVSSALLGAELANSGSYAYYGHEMAHVTEASDWHGEHN